jgi:hypothetical protein
MTVTGGVYNADTNPFKELRNLSLNLVTNTTGIDFLNNGIVVYNPLLNDPQPTPRRFQFEYDSAPDWFTGAALTTATNGVTGADEIIGMQAFSFGDSVYKGIGPTCLANNLCMNTGTNGPPAWLLASIAFKTLQSPGLDVKLNLEIGANGMNHANESSAQTMVKFGLGPTTYDASLLSNRETHDVALADLTIRSCAAIAGDYNGNCAADVADYTVWRNTKGQAASPAGSGADGDVSGTIGPGDYDVWKTSFGNVSGSGSLTGAAVPEPAALVLLFIGAPSLFSRRRARAR